MVLCYTIIVQKVDSSYYNFVVKCKCPADAVTSTLNVYRRYGPVLIPDLT